MIRLKHSEITLAPADVEGTRRRMERRQAANAPTTLAPRAHGPPVLHSLRAHLRRGPERSRNDSMKRLGDVPILRPQQAIHSSIDEPGDPPRPQRDLITERSEAVPSTLTGFPLPNQPTSDVASTTTALTLPLSGDEIRLPFRSSPLDRGSSLFASQEDTSEIDTPSPSKLHLSPPRVGRSRTNSSEPGNDEPSSSLHPSSTDGNVDTAITLQTTTRHQTHSLDQHSAHHPSTLQHVQEISQPRQGGQAHEGVFTG
ncbi:hypothetical protein BU23DRAFT_236231 [Bimuria novae-zelandiae CBS 107.79]|uniref:Uncharacterized protein n=1 Tax=Bimuria novae-zelandiae CBS 107.79 TaxID=1447943 RepID=A0A6A5V0E7_9PLEO|nr:hypothetical protein BU23DRAFT_236231 [Bimuria novae-zelandiae CBS 107.79]